MSRYGMVACLVVCWMLAGGLIEVQDLAKFRICQSLELAAVQDLLTSRICRSPGFAKVHGSPKARICQSPGFAESGIC